MVEARVDKSLQCIKMMSGRKHLLFKSFKDTVNIKEPQRDVNGLHFTWNNLRLNGIRVLARLDRCYSFTPDRG